jgi:hypothetical protein
MTLDNIRKLIKDNQIQSVTDIGNMLNSKRIVSIPHKDFKTEFNCYGELLFGPKNVYKFEQAITELKKLDLSKITTPLEFVTYYDSIFDDALKGENNNKFELSILMNIPRDPKHYYQGEWKDTEETNDDLIGWDYFLGKPLNNTIGIEIKTDNYDKLDLPENTQNGLINNIVNDDHKTVEKLQPVTYIDYNTSLDLSIIKNWIYTKFNIEHDLLIRPQLNKRGQYMNFVINVHMLDSNITYVPIVIYDTCKVKYGKNINKCKSTAERTEQTHITDSNIQDLIKNLDTEIKNHFRTLNR